MKPRRLPSRRTEWDSDVLSRFLRLALLIALPVPGAADPIRADDEAITGIAET